MCSVCSLTVLRTKAQLAIDNDLQFCSITEWYTEDLSRIPQWFQGTACETGIQSAAKLGHVESQYGCW